MLRMSIAIGPFLRLLRGLYKDRNIFTFSNVRYPSFCRSVYTIQLNSRWTDFAEITYLHYAIRGY